MLLTLEKYAYFTIDKQLLCILDPDVEGYIMVEDCKTLEVAFIKIEDFERMEVNEICLSQHS